MNVMNWCAFATAAMSAVGPVTHPICAQMLTLPGNPGFLARAPLQTVLRPNPGTGLCISPLALTFQPVRENVLPAEPICTHLSSMPGKLRSETCRLPSNTKCSYTYAWTKQHQHQGGLGMHDIP